MGSGLERVPALARKLALTGTPAQALLTPLALQVKIGANKIGLVSITFVLNTAQTQPIKVYSLY